MNAFGGGGCLWLYDISINVNKLLAVLLLPVYLFIRFLYTVLCCCLFTSLSPVFKLMLLLYFCLLVDHVNKPISFVFGTFVYHFKNTVSIFVTLFIQFQYLGLRWSTLCTIVHWLVTDVLNIGIIWQVFGLPQTHLF